MRSAALASGVGCGVVDTRVRRHPRVFGGRRMRPRAHTHTHTAVEPTRPSSVDPLGDAGGGGGRAARGQGQGGARSPAGQAAAARAPPPPVRVHGGPPRTRGGGVHRGGGGAVWRGCGAAVAVVRGATGEGRVGWVRGTVSRPRGRSRRREAGGGPAGGGGAQGRAHAGETFAATGFPLPATLGYRFTVNPYCSFLDFIVN
jgi:hypothetical protein